MVTILHTMSFLPNERGMTQLLEHLRYGDLIVISWEKSEVTDYTGLTSEGYKVKLDFTGNKSFWESQVKKRAESLGIEIEEL